MLRPNTLFLLFAAMLAVLPLAPPAMAEGDTPTTAPQSKKKKKGRADRASGLSGNFYRLADLESEPYSRGVIVFEAGKGNPYASIRIPDIINANGLLVAMAEGRYSNSDQGQNDLIVSTSKDGGKHWSRPTVALASHGATYNNPCLIYDPATKQIVLFFQRYPEGVKERDPNIPTGHQDKRAIRNFVSFSKNGKSWSKPKDVTEFTKNEDVTITCSGPNPGVCLSRGPHKGRLVVPLNEGPFGNWTLAAAYSDDHGKTWHIGRKSASGCGVNEVSVAETEQGELLIVSRAWGGSYRKVAYSQDGGESWGDIHEHAELPSPNVQNGLTRYSFADDKALGGRGRVLFSSPTQGSRRDGIIKMSYDDGKTWPVARMVGSGPFAYSVLCPVCPGVVGLLYEVNGNPLTTIKFTPVSISWLTRGEDTGMATTPENTDAKPPRKKKKKSQH